MKQIQIICVCILTREVLEEKYTSCKNTFQSHKEYYCQHPLALKLLALQTEKEEIEKRIKAYDGEITIKEKELTHLTGNETCYHSHVYDQVDIQLYCVFITLWILCSLFV